MLKKVYWGDKNYSQCFCGKFNENVNVYLSNDNFLSHDSYENKVWGGGEPRDFSYIRVANVSYYLNDGTDDTFFVDYAVGTKVNVKAPEPLRDGYKFLGWYKDGDCLVAWNFDEDIVDKFEIDEAGAEIYSETKLYAKWECL